MHAKISQASTIKCAVILKEALIIRRICGNEREFELELQTLRFARPNINQSRCTKQIDSQLLCFQLYGNTESNTDRLVKDDIITELDNDRVYLSDSHKEL
ncbi:hypothetical protein GJ496_003727 [Pomphorhynchus laevis]|nr:hypothetical protein GJ496_003727 [Pomphorhynchus laevis]